MASFDLISLFVRIVIVISLLTLSVWNFPSPCAVEVYNWDRQSMSGPLLRSLKQVDPNKTWKISLTQKTIYLNIPMMYYRQFGYRFNTQGFKNPDIVVLDKTEKAPNAQYFKEDFFSEFNCWVLINPYSKGVFEK